MHGANNIRLEADASDWLEIFGGRERYMEQYIGVAQRTRFAESWVRTRGGGSSHQGRGVR